MTPPNSHQADQAVTEKIGLFCDLKNIFLACQIQGGLQTTGSRHLTKFKIIITQYLIYAFLTTCNVMAKAEKKKTAKSKVSAIPKGYHSVIPVLVVKGAEQAIEFYKKAFGAKELGRAYMPGSNIILHAEMQIGDSRIMLNDEFPEMNCKSPQSVGGASTALYVYVKDVEKIFTQASAAGATVTMPVMDAFWGDRTGQLIDPYGHVWSFATRKRNLSPKELQKAQEEWLSKMTKGQQTQQPK
jgi:PhnB protein